MGAKLRQVSLLPSPASVEARARVFKQCEARSGVAVEGGVLEAVLRGAAELRPAAVDARPRRHHWAGCSLPRAIRLVAAWRAGR